jgi:hypothetical protein
MDMKRMIPLFFIFWAGVMPFTVKAQERGAVSVAGGYMYAGDIWDSAHGWNVSVAGNAVKHLALVADFSGFSLSDSWFQSKSAYSNYSLLFGPRFVTGKQWMPFAHVLYGLYRENKNVTGSPAAYNESSSRSHFVLDLGGGLDIRVSNRVSARLLQLDVIGPLSRGCWFGPFGRVSFGAVIHLNRVSPKS